MEHSQDDSGLFPSLPHFFNQLEAILAEEYQSSNTPWIHVTRLKEILYQRNGISLDVVIQSHGFGNNLKGLLNSSQRFAIYSTAISQEFYVARLQDTVPNHHQNRGKPIQYRIKRPWKVDQRLINMLDNEGAMRLSPSPFSKRSVDQPALPPRLLSVDDSQGETHLSPSPSPQRSAYQPTLPPRLSSVDDLELALPEILRRLTHDRPEKATTIAALSKAFYNYYRQPIRTAVRSLCPDMMLVDMLEMMSNLEVLENDDGEVMIDVIGI